MITVPARVAANMIAAALTYSIRALEQRPALLRRKEAILRLERQRKHLWHLAGACKRPIDVTVAGLLTAWALGFHDAIRELQDYLDESGRSDLADAIDNVSSSDVELAADFIFNAPA